MTRILLFGKNGQIGNEAFHQLSRFSEVIHVSLPEFDITDLTRLEKLIRNISPDIIYNAAAYTDVDRAESEENKVFLVNATAPEVMAKTAARINALFIHFSTDYVFDGSKTIEYTENDLPHPVNLYGKSKFIGEKRVLATDCDALIFRSSWIYSLNNGGFVLKVLEWAKKETELRIVFDQVSNPTWARTLVQITSLIIKRWEIDRNFVIRNKGIYNISASGNVSRYEWAKKILSLYPFKKEIVAKKITPVLTSEFPTPAKRPLYTPLNNKKLIDTFDVSQINWLYALRNAMGEIKVNQNNCNGV